MSRLSIYREGSRVAFRVLLPFHGESFDFTFTCAQEWIAKLLVSALRIELEGRCESIRREAYAQGYRDGRAKRARETFFSSELP